MLRILLALTLLSGVVAGGLWLRTQARIDDCLDDGGRWNAEAEACEGARSEGLIPVLSSDADPGLEFLNATSVPISFVFGDSDLASLRALLPGEQIEVPGSWASMVLVDRGVAGANPLHFVIHPAEDDPESQALLVFYGYSLYLVDASRWPSPAPTFEERIAELATRRILPLD